MELVNNGDLDAKITEMKKKGGFIPESEIWSIFT
jgi:NIMA (never in mitosis gene a)-related kinase